MPPIRWQQLNLCVHLSVCVFTHLLLSQQGLCVGTVGFALWWHCHFHYVPMGRVFKLSGWLLCLSGPSSITKIAAITFWPMFVACWPDSLICPEALISAHVELSCLRSYWRESSRGLRGWWGDWSISPIRKGWGSWACSAWRREGCEGT